MGRRKWSQSQKQVVQGAETTIWCQTILDLKNGRYKVESKSHPEEFYDVNVLEGKWACTCPYYINDRARCCKH